MLVAAFVVAHATAEEVPLALVADTSIAAFPGERTLNYGHSPRLKLKGLENIILFAVDAGPLQGQVVDQAVLHLRACAGDLMMRTVGLSTVASPWNEGLSQGDGPRACPREAGSHQVTPTRHWAWAGNDEESASASDGVAAQAAWAGARTASAMVELAHLVPSRQHRLEAPLSTPASAL
jgi:hypothetical protein